MPGEDLLFDDDGDYIDSDDGFFEETLTVGPSVRHAILDILDAWVGDLTAGREQRGISGRNASQLELDLERESILNALAPLERQGLIENTEVEATKVAPTRFSISVRTFDTQSGGAIQVVKLAEFGS